MMQNLRVQITAVRDRIDALSLRERAMVFAAFMVVLYLIATSLVFGPLRAEHGRVQQDLKAKRDQLQAAELQIQTLASSGSGDANSQNRAKVAALKQQLQQLDAEMDSMTAGVVAPKEMAKLVERMLSQNRGLELIKLENLPAAPLADTKAAPAQTADAQVYKHGMRVQLRGRYADVVEYLKALEALPWKVFWGEVSLEAEKYPSSKVTFVIYTLSRHSGWIGV